MYNVVAPALDMALGQADLSWRVTRCKERPLFSIHPTGEPRLTPEESPGMDEVGPRVAPLQNLL